MLRTEERRGQKAGKQVDTQKEEAADPPRTGGKLISGYYEEATICYAEGEV